MSAKMVQSVVEILDSAHHYRYELAEVLEGIQSLEDQVNISSDDALKKIDSHFTKLKSAVLAALDLRLSQLHSEVERIRESELKPLEECRALVEENMRSAAQVMQEGREILADDPDNCLDKIIKFKDNPNTKALSSVPAIPCNSEVAAVNVVLSEDIQKCLEMTVASEGHVHARAPVQVGDIVEKPGSLLVSWAEIDEESESEISEFWLQYSMGAHPAINSSSAVYHTGYVGSATSYLVKHLRVQTPYTFRVCGRGESNTPWSAWSVPKVASTQIEHYRWGQSIDNAYCLSNEDKTATRTSEGLSHVLYSSSASFLTGNVLTIKVLDDADKSPGDGLCISQDNSAAQAFGTENTIYLNLYGNVYVDGQEMTMQLPEIKKGSVVAFHAELLPNGKVRTSIQNEDKEVTFDWKVQLPAPQMMMGMGAGMGDSQPAAFYFGIKFSQEDWKIAVD